MPVIMKEAVEIPVGPQTGVITSVPITTSENATKETVEYVNVLVQTEHKFETSDGIGVYRGSFPNYLSKSSQYGRFLTGMGIPLPQKGESFDERTLEGARVNFKAVKVPNKKGTGFFVNPDMDSFRQVKS